MVALFRGGSKSLTSTSSNHHNVTLPMNLIENNANQSDSEAVAIKTLFNFSPRISPSVNKVLQRQHLIAEQLREYYSTRYKSSEGIQTGAILGSALLLCFLYIIYKAKCKNQYSREKQAVLHARLDQRINSLRMATLKAKLNHQGRAHKPFALSHNDVDLPPGRLKTGLLKTHQWLLNQKKVRSSQILVMPRLCQSQPCVSCNNPREGHNQAGENLLQRSEPLLSLSCPKHQHATVGLKLNSHCTRHIQYY